MRVTSSQWMALSINLMLAFVVVLPLPLVFTTTVVAQVTPSRRKVEAINDPAGEYITLSNMRHDPPAIDSVQRSLAMTQSVNGQAGEELISRQLASGSTTTCPSTPYRFSSVSSSSDNRHLISLVSQLSSETGSSDYQIKQWDLMTGEEVPLSFAIPPSLSDSSQGFTRYYFLSGVAFSPDGRTLVGAYYDIVYSNAIVKSWQLETGRETRTLQIHFDSSDTQIGNVQLSSDGNTFIRYGYDSSGLTAVTLWDLASNRLIRTVQFPHAVNGAAVSLDDQTIAIQETDRTINVRNLSNGRTINDRPIQLVNQAGDIWNTLALSSDGSTLVVGDRNGSIRIFNTATGELIQTIGSVNPTTDLPFLALSADNSTLFTSDKGELQQWNVGTGRLIHTFCIR